MPTTDRPALFVIACLGASALLAASAVADDLVTARLADGRTVRGIVDLKTDSQFLWLRRSTEQFDLVSGYAWDQVREAQIDGRAIDNPQRRTGSTADKTAARKFAELPAAPGNAVPKMVAAPQGPSAGPLKTLVVDAELAQWDKDAQTDGLRIFVSPLDASGRLVPIRGHIEFTLAVQREYTSRTPGYVKGPEFVEGARLSFPVEPEQFTAGPAVFELPFSRWHPDFEATLAPQALLYARLSVPGQGVFEASDAQVCLRELSRFRDQLQYYTPGRYLPLENPSRDGR